MSGAFDGPASDLDVLEIDSPELRWLAARDYIHEQEQIVTRQINAVFLAAEFCDLAEANAFKRGEPMRGTFCVGFKPCWARGDQCSRHQWGPRLVPNDYLTAHSSILSRYKGQARMRADQILRKYIPSSLWSYL